MKSSIVNRLVCFTFVALLALSLSAQPVNTKLNDVAMAAPNAASLGKYVEAPVSYATGIPNINIPVFDVQEGTLSVPISLNYHASGHKIAEPAGWVGLGWSLSAGGIVSRSIIGIADDNTGGGYYYFGNQVNTFTGQEVANGLKDAEPDVFSFNFGNYSGKFVLNITGSSTPVTLIPKQDLKVIPYFNGTLDGFTIISPDGVRFIFGKTTTADYREMTPESDLNGNPGSPIYATSWYLQKIERYDQKEYISFEYENEDYSFRSPLTVNKFYENYWTGTVGSETNGIEYPARVSTQYIPSFVKGKRLKRIVNSSNTVEVLFVANTYRDDLDPYSVTGVKPKRLDEIQIKSGGTAFCKKFQLSYSYFKDPSVPNDAHGKRLQLTAVTESSCDGTITLPPYSITYDGSVNGDGSKFMPHRLSKRIDHWGYYNAALVNDNLAVNVPSTTINTPGYPLLTYGSANRESNETAMKNGIIQKIVYPTGGHTLFEFEANKIAGATYGNLETVLTLSNCPAVNGNSISECCNSNSASGSYTFLTDEPAGAEFDLYLNDLGPQNNPPLNRCLTGMYTVDITVTAYNNGVQVGNPVSANIPVNTTTTPPSGPGFGGETFPLSAFGASFQPNISYTFTINVQRGKGTFFLKKRPIVSQNKPVGGLRIKKITQYDPISIKSNVKDYKYEEENQPGISSGKLFVQPKYGYYINKALTLGYYTKRLFSANSIVPLGDFNGYHITYKRVEEIQTGAGKRVFTFKVGVIPFVGDQYPIPPFLYDAENQQITSKQSYLEGAATAIEQQNSPYGQPNYNNAPGNRYKTFYKEILANGTIYITEVVPYTIQTGNYRVSSSDYVIDGVNSTTITTYDPQDRHNLPITVTTTNSDGKTTITNNKYVFDLTAGCLKDELTNRNILGPFETSVTVNNVQVDGFRTTWSMFDALGFPQATCLTGWHPYPYTFHRYEMTWDAAGTPQAGAWNLQGTVNQYNSNGYASQYTQDGWLPETYTWQNGLIKSRLYQNFSWVYDYYPGSRLLNKIKDIDGQETWFSYDKIMRLEKSWARYSGNDTTTAKIKTRNIYEYINGSIPSRIRSFKVIPQVAGSSLGLTQDIEYFDGLGRSIQKIAVKSSPDNKDVVEFITYDDLGRLSREYIPMLGTNSDGSYVSNIPTTLQYTETFYEPSPLRRISKVTPPDWYPTLTEYGTNTGSEVYNYATSSQYSANTLFKTTVTEPDPGASKIGNPTGNKTITFKDKKGRTILVRKTNNAGNFIANTYHVYDDKDRLIQVVPHGASLNSSLSFKYLYDGSDNQIEKNVPDGGKTTMKYNARDQLAFSQDNNLLALGKWRCTRYDNYGRSIKTGLYSGTLPNPIPLTQDPTDLYTETIYDGTLPIETGKIKTAKARVFDTSNWLETNYNYDAYGRVSQTNGNSHLNLTVGSDVVTFSSYDWADNLLAQTRAFKPDPLAATRTIEQTQTYDHRGRLKSNTFRVDANPTTTISELNYNWKNELIEKNLGKTAASHLQSLDYTYNTMGWLTMINNPALHSGSSVAVSTCPTVPTLPNPATGATLDNNDLFYLELKYDALFSGLSGTAQKNGNIAQLLWRTRGRERQAYSVTYDYLNRMSTSSYAGISDVGTVNLNNFYRENISYNDARGNIRTVTRNGLYKTAAAPSCWTAGLIDSLLYTTTTGSNKLSQIAERVSDATAKAQGFNPGTDLSTATFLYDANGNMTFDPYKNLTIEYNFLNLPKKFTFAGNKTVEILYDGIGGKLRKTVKDNGVLQYAQDYVDGIEYRNTGATNSTLRLEAIYHPEGRVFNTNVLSGGTEALRYEYTIADHLGSARVTFTDKNGDGVIQVTNTASNEILQENQYYPFGMSMNGPWVDDATAKDNLQKYTGKEINEDFGLNWYDYGARWYDAAVGRWWSVDPMGEESTGWAPYNFVKNNPIRLFDPTGMAAEDIYWYINGKYIKASDYGGKDFTIIINENKQVLSSSVFKSSKVPFYVEQLSGIPTSKMTEAERLVADILGVRYNDMTAQIKFADGVNKALKYGTEAYMTVEGARGVYQGVKWGAEVLTSKTVVDVVVNYNSVLNSANSAYKGTTVLGHALSKHAGRNPKIWGKLTGNPSTWHNQALKHYKDIMHAPGGFSKTTTSQGLNFLEKKLPDGRGIRLNLDGTFKGFID